ncbi:MAG: YdjY domain-containing protein [Gemmatales bacterium]|nr:YdjY domain-containing protein [Gemmatales bacterium]MDW7995417.1 YdjY domain-containing protein [Gemmatales bacterium]
MRYAMLAYLGLILGWACSAEEAPAPALPQPGSLIIDRTRGEVILSAKVQHPRGQPCIDEYGERVQAFVGCAQAAGGEAKMAEYFVFLVDVPTEQVYEALIQLGCKPRVHYSIQEGRKRSGLKPTTTPEDYLQGDPVQLSIFWREGERWVERPYQDFVTERVLVDGKPTEKPWTPHFVFHGSGVIHKSGTGCIACPCDCAGGIIADNRYPVYDPKPMVKFDLSKAPKEGTQVYVRIRPLISRN